MAKSSAAAPSGELRKFGMLDKVAYAAGDFGCNMSFALAGTFFTLFWTQYMGIDSLVFAGLLVLLKVWDAINDPLIGSLIDASKMENKFKKFISIGSVGLLIAAALCFLPFPQAPGAVKVILCLFGYIAWDACYTVVNVPYGSMLGIITADPAQRSELSAWRSLGSLFASLPMGIALPLFLYDENNNVMGGRLFATALALGVVGFIAFRFMLANTVERVPAAPKTEDAPKFNFFKAFANFLRNRPAIGATMLPVAMFLGMYGAGTASTVMFQSYFQNAKISGLMQLITTLPMLIFVPFVGKITAKFGKKEGASAGIILSVVATALMIVVPMPANGTGIAIYMGLQLLNGMGMGIANCVTYAMVADAIDYNEWKNGARDEGSTYALHSFFRKLAQGIGPSIGLVLMVALGYDEALQAAQPLEVALRMRYLVAVMFFVSSLIMFAGAKLVYNLDKKSLAEMEHALGRDKK